MTQPENEPVRWGVLGVASIFERRMAPAFASAENAEIVALASRSRDRAEAAAERFSIARAFGAYDDLLADPRVEAVYIPLPNHLHVEWTLAALAAGKHVLCDKPLSPVFADAQQCAQAAQSSGLRLMEGFMHRHHPQHARAAEIAQSGALGDIVHFRGAFTYAAEARHKSTYRFDASAGGGALLDVGVYPLNTARLLFGSEPESVIAAQVLDPQGSGVEVRVIATLNFPGGRTAVIEGGFDQTFTIRYDLVGSVGVVSSERAYQPGDGPVTLSLRTGDDVRTETIPGTNHYVREIEHFGQCVRDPEKPLWPGEDGLAQARVVEAVRRSLRENRRVSLDEIGAD